MVSGHFRVPLAKGPTCWIVMSHKQTKIRAMQAELCVPRQTCLAHMYKILEAHSMGRTKQAFEGFVLRMTGMLGFPASASGMASSKERPGGREVKH